MKPVMLETLYWYDGPILATFTHQDQLWLGQIMADMKGMVWPMIMVSITAEMVNTLKEELASSHFGDGYRTVLREIYTMEKKYFLHDYGTDIFVPFKMTEYFMPE